MYLNSAKVTSWVLNGKDYTGSRKRFMKALCETHNFTVNLVLGNKLLGRGNVSFMENSGWVMAHVDSRFAFDKDEHISGLTISICNNGNEILSSETEVSYFISGNMSTDADLYFIDKIQLQEHLSPTRNNGIVAMLKQMRLFALTYLSILK